MRHDKNTQLKGLSQHFSERGKREKYLHFGGGNGGRGAGDLLRRTDTMHIKWVLIATFSMKRI